MEFRDRNGNLVTGERYEAAWHARIQKTHENYAKANETGVLDFRGDVERVKEAMWTAVEKYDAEHPDEVPSEIQSEVNG